MAKAIKTMKNGGSKPRKRKQQSVALQRVVDWSDAPIKAKDGTGVSVDEIHDALKATEGRTAKTARLLNLDIMELYRLIEQTPVLQEVIFYNRELMLDEAEDSIKTNFERDPWLAMEFLKRQGKRRGYAERDSGVPTRVLVEFVKDWRGTGNEGSE